MFYNKGYFCWDVFKPEIQAFERKIKFLMLKKATVARKKNFACKL